jgi:hypothetical protein
MAQSAARIAATLATILLSGSLALAQQTPTPQPAQETVPTPAFDQGNWAKASALASSKHKLIIATAADPTRRRACRVKSFTPDQLVCKGNFGTTNTYKPQEIAALIIPGNKDFRLGAFLIFNVVGAAAMWGTVELAAACIPCAFATDATAILIARRCRGHRDGGRPEVLLYLTPGQTLQVKLH